MVPLAPTWQRRTPDPIEVERLANGLGCHPLLARLLVNRGFVAVSAAERFLAPGREDLPDPFAIPGMADAVSRIQRAIDRGEAITVYGDRDVDGVTGAVLLVRLLDDLGATVGFEAPRRYDGHGVAVQRVLRLLERDTSLLITVDCGITAGPALGGAAALGMDVIVTDHHPASDPPPAATACIHPAATEAALTGAGIAWQVGRALVDAGRVDPADVRSYALPLAALGTVIDRGPPTRANRAITRVGYELLSECPLPAIRALLDRYPVDSMADLSWRLGPVLSAAKEAPSGRLLFRFLLAEESTRLERLLDRLESLRRRRRRDRRAQRACLLERLQAVEDADADVLFLETDDYAIGGTGRVAERTGRPVIAYCPADGTIAGGGRAGSDVDLRATFERQCPASCWGHPGFAGFEVEPDRWAPFERGVRRDIAAQRADPGGTIWFDARLAPDAVSATILALIEPLRPFVRNNPQPTFCTPDLELRAVRRFGPGDRHVSFQAPAVDGQVTFWDADPWLDAWAGPGRYDVLWRPARDRHAGSLVMSVLAVRAATATELN